MNRWDKWLDLFERAAWTFVEVFSASVVLTNSLGFGDLKIAGGAAVLSALKTISIDSTVKGQLKVLDALKPKRARARRH